jgi:MscS family membrane protein
MTNRRIYETIGIRYDDIDKMEAITKDVETMLKNHPDIDTSSTLMVNFVTFAASSLNFFVYTFTKTTVWTEFHAIKQDVLLKISDIIAAHGAEIAFPTSTIHMADSIAIKNEPAVSVEPS